MYEYECEKCGKVTSFQEKMHHVEPLFFGRKKCPACKSKKLKRVLSSFSAQPKASYTDQLNELKSMGNVQFVPQQPGMEQPQGPPGGVCPYEKQFKAEEASKAAAEREKKLKEPIVVKGG